MSLNEIKEAIAKLPVEERRALARALTPRKIELTPEERARIQAKADAVPPGAWVKWEDLKAELSRD